MGISRRAHHRLDDGEIQLVDGDVFGAAGIAAEYLGQADGDVAGRSVGRPEGAGERVVGEGPPPRRAAVRASVEALRVKGEPAVGNEPAPGAVLVDIPLGGHGGELLRQDVAAVRRPVVVRPHVGEDGVIVHLSDLRPAVAEQIGPRIDPCRSLKGVAELQIAVVDEVGGDRRHMADVARIVHPSRRIPGLGVALRRNVGRLVGEVFPFHRHRLRQDDAGGQHSSSNGDGADGAARPARHRCDLTVRRFQRPAAETARYSRHRPAHPWGCGSSCHPTPHTGAERRSSGSRGRQCHRISRARSLRNHRESSGYGSVSGS